MVPEVITYSDGTVMVTPVVVAVALAVNCIVPLLLDLQLLFFL